MNAPKKQSEFQVDLKDEKSTCGAEEALAELAEHLVVLESEVRRVTRRAKVLLEECWMVRHTEIFPKLCDWKEATSATDFLTFSVKKANLRFEQLLSSQNLEKSTEYDVSGLVSLALAGQEMQFDFEHKYVVLPLSFFDHVVGIVVAQIPTLKVSEYENVIAESSALLSSLRRVVMSGRLSHLQNISQNPSQKLSRAS